MDRNGRIFDYASKIPTGKTVNVKLLVLLAILVGILILGVVSDLIHEHSLGP